MDDKFVLGWFVGGISVLIPIILGLAQMVDIYRVMSPAQRDQLWQILKDFWGLVKKVSDEPPKSESKGD